MGHATLEASSLAAWNKTMVGTKHFKLSVTVVPSSTHTMSAIGTSASSIVSISSSSSKADEPLQPQKKKRKQSTP